MKKTLFLSMVASSVLLADSDVEELKKLVRQQQEMIQTLQSRVETLEQVQPATQTASAPEASSNRSKSVKHASTKKAQKTKTDQAVAPLANPIPSVVSEEYDNSPEEAVSLVQNNSSSFDQSAFLPDIALVANMSAVGRNISNELYATYSIPGFVEAPADIPFNPNRGFNFNYAELDISSSVGPYLDVFAVFPISAEGIEVEEAYVTTRTLPYNMRLKAGQFKSDFGRINPEHQHAWSFSSIPLVLEGFFGPEGMSDTGMQLQWVAPADFYLMAGVEALQGSNEMSFGDTDGIGLMVGYLKSAVDLSDNTTMLTGLTYMQGKDGFGDTKIYGADLTFKTSFDSYSGIKWQNEYYYREKPYEDATADQAGFYSELIYDLNQNWSGGIRYDSLTKNIPDEPEPLDRYTAMLMYKPFEFTKLRLQYTYDKSMWFGDEHQNVQEILLDLTIEAGAHGAHAF